MRKRKLFITIFVVISVIILPNVARADNCGGFDDCLKVIGALFAVLVGVVLFIALLPFLPAILTGVSGLLTYIGIVEFFSGKSVLTGEKLAFWERVLGIVPFGAFVSVAKSVRFAREATALKFYKKLGWSNKMIADHLRGIDFNKAVKVEVLRKGTKVQQWKFTSFPDGNYFSPIGSSPTQLGIYSNGRELGTYVLTEDVKVLRSTANAVEVTWEVPGIGILTEGGGTQFFTLDPTKFLKIIE